MRDLSAAMAGCGNGNAGLRDRCPRCDVCGKVVRVRGVGANGVWCVSCLSDALPFVGLNGEGEFKAALREYREGLGSRARQFEGLRLDPYDEEVRRALGGAGMALGGCSYTEGDEVVGKLKGLAKTGGCGLSLMFLKERKGSWLRAAAGRAKEVGGAVGCNGVGRDLVGC